MPASTRGAIVARRSIMGQITAAGPATAERFIRNPPAKDAEAARLHLVTRFAFSRDDLRQRVRFCLRKRTLFGAQALSRFAAAVLRSSPLVDTPRTQSVPSPATFVRHPDPGFNGLVWLWKAARTGHAIAWLVSVPLCALLLVGRKAAGTWAVLSFAAGAGVVPPTWPDWNMPPTYPHMAGIR